MVESKKDFELFYLRTAAGFIPDLEDQNKESVNLDDVPEVKLLLTRCLVSAGSNIDDVIKSIEKDREDDVHFQWIPAIDEQIRRNKEVGALV